MNFPFSQCVAELFDVIAAIGQQRSSLGHGSSARAPMSSLVCPALRYMSMGRPFASATVCSLEFSLPLVRPANRLHSPFCPAGWTPCGGLSDGSRRS